MNMSRLWKDRWQFSQQLEMLAWKSENRSGPEETNLNISHMDIIMETPGYIKSSTKKWRSGKKAPTRTPRDTLSLRT